MLTDLYLHRYETEFKNNNIFLFRYIDDITLISSNDVITFHLPIKYPFNLMLSSNLLQNNCLHFLNSNIHLLNNKLQQDIYDKRTDLKFNVNIFTHFKSCLVDFTGVLYLIIYLESKIFIL